MNIVSLGIVLFDRPMDVAHSVTTYTNFFLIGLAILVSIWWGVWGQIAVADGWWVYGPENIAGVFIGAIPAVDVLYFLAGLGWYFTCAISWSSYDRVGRVSSFKRGSVSRKREEGRRRPGVLVQRVTDGQRQVTRKPAAGRQVSIVSHSVPMRCRNTFSGAECGFI